MRQYKSAEEVIADVERDLGVPLRLDGEELKIGGLRYWFERIFKKKIKKRLVHQYYPTGDTYDDVRANNLTPEELAGSRLPDDSLVSIHVYFKSQANKSYLAAHNWYQERHYPKTSFRDHSYTRPEAAQIRLCSTDKDKDDFKFVEKILRKITGGKTDGSNSNDDWDSLRREWGEDVISDVWSHIYLKGRLTQTKVASFAQAYALHFNEVNIWKCFYHNVPRLSFEDSGLPLEKLVVRNIIW